jgi:hypothetical protein
LEADPSAPSQPEFENITFEVPFEISRWFDLFAKVKRLREVRAYCGFTRVQPLPLPIEKIRFAIDRKEIAALSVYRHNWFPAIEVRGEGIFLRFREDTVREWQDDKGVISRADTINSIYNEICEKSGSSALYKITPRLLLIHSFSHAMIRRLSLDCGYNSASLRERLYISDGDGTCPPMAGILIYTASPDSDGSLGGLVSLASPQRIMSLILTSLQDASWCGNDPVCVETSPELLGDRLSGASCHNCLLLPETACEKFNRELDRVLLCGIKQNNEEYAIKGFFGNLNL